MNNIEKFVLMLKEKEMGNEIPSDELEFFNKMNEYYNTDLEFKNLVNLTMAATSQRELESIIGGKIMDNNDETMLIPIDEIRQTIDETPQGGEEKPKVYVKTNGYADALILSLVSGFILGTATTILFILM